MTPREFVKKWKATRLGERQAAQSHFNDLCALLGHPTPTEDDPAGERFAFEYGAAKRGGGEGFADVWKRGFFAWEYKGKHADLAKAYDQLDRYRADLENPPLLVTCDLDRFEIHTSFQNTKRAVFRIALEDLLQPERLEILRAVFFDPEKLRPGRISPVVTADAAKALGELAQRLRDRGIEPRAVARFLDRIIFTLFAEDIGLLPNEVASKLFRASRGKPELFEQLLGELFAKMAAGGFFGVDKILRFNGSLFDDAATLPLRPPELGLLAQAADLDWSAIDPSIFGTLFERGLDPGKRAQLGAHYTSREDIELLVEPVVMAPLRKEWEQTKELVLRVLSTGKKTPGPPPGSPLTGAALKKAQLEGRMFIERFQRRLESVKVLDPACGSGNFLYVTLRKLMDLESEVHDFAMDQGDTRPLRSPGVGPWQLYGIEINQYAHELAQMTVWIGYLQWLRQHGTTVWDEPILQAMSNIECKDAILDLSDPENPREPTWPKVDFIVSNPPFLGGKLLRRELGDSYVDKLFELWGEEVPREADLCCYWFERARKAISEGKGVRAGLLATQGIRGGANRKVLERIKDTGDIFWAWSDRDWILDGAAVHVSMVGFDSGRDALRHLDGVMVERINVDLSFGAATTTARRLEANQGLSFMGDTKGGPFELLEVEATPLLPDPNPHGRPNSDVLVPWCNGLDVTRRGRGLWIIDFPPGTGEVEASCYQAVFATCELRVKKARLASRSSVRAWWLHERPRPDMRSALSLLKRFLGTVTVAKHRLFVWFSEPTLPDHQVIALALEQDSDFGVLHSRVHEAWALAQGTQLEDRPRYTPTTCFETFPFPLLERDAEAAISAAARELDELRGAWLNPPEWTKEEVLEFPGSVDGPWKRFVHDPDSRGIGTVRWPRVVAKDAASAKELAGRTLTKLYNRRPAWLDLAHKKIDEAVFAAYGWPPDLSDGQILERLLALNLERAAGQA